MAISFGILILATAIFVLLSFFSTKSALKCAETSKNEASFSVAANRSLNIPGTDYDTLQKGSQQLLLTQCLNNSFLAKNAANTVALSINFFIVLILSLLYQFLFNNSEGNTKLGRATIMALILSMVYLLSLLFGFIGMFFAIIGGIWVLTKILNTDIIGALFFIVILFFLNSVVNHMLAKLIVG